MELQINYGGAPVQEQKIYGKSRAGGGCMKIFSVLIILVIIIAAGFYFVYPALTPNSIRGNFLDMAIVPQKDGSQDLWILTDGSFRFVQTTKSPGSYSTGVKCYFCKTWTYVYDPAAQKILKKIKTEQQDVITTMNIFYNSGKVYVVTGGYHENEPKIEIYDAISSEMLMDTKQFAAKYPVLSGGISEIRYDEKQGIIDFETKDGRKQITYSIEKEKMYDNFADFSKEKGNSQRIISIIALSPEQGSGNSRKKLFRLTGKEGNIIMKRSSVESFPISQGAITPYDSITADPLGDRVYLEGIIYHEDKDCAIFIHLDQLGKKSNRMMTCVDTKTGKEKWTAQQDDMFKKMKIDENSDSFSSLFFTKDKIKVRRSGNLVILEMKGEGLIGFDYETGKQLWKLNI